MIKRLCLLAALTLSFSTISCTKIQARMAIKQANEAYEKEDYKTALSAYEKARAIDKSFPELDRLVGYSLIGLYKPEDKTPANAQVADRASKELRTYLQKKPNDTAAREALINLYLNAERTDDAINFFREYLKSKPGDLDAVRSIATLYAKKGDFNESLNWYEKVTLLDSKNPESFYVFGVVCYENVAKNPNVDPVAKPAIIERGKQSLTRALELKKDYFEAAVYMNLLFREQAKLEPDPIKQQALYAKADEYRNRAMAINKARQASQKKGA